MKLIHKLKSASHDIPLDTERAMDGSAFASYISKDADGNQTPIAVGWRFLSAQEGKEKYTGHSFELVLEPDEIERAIEALQILRDRFSG